jgi:acyl-CoA thioesterase-1
MIRVLLLIILAVVGFIVFTYVTRPEPLLPTAGTNIIVFGDSLAEGQGASAGNDIASLISKKLNEPVINLGVSGDTTDDALARIKEVTEADPKIVIIILGGNDVLQKTPMVTTFQNLAIIVEEIQKTGSAIIIVGAPGGLNNKQYGKAYKDLAEQYQTFYVSNILSGLIARPEYMSDYIHPNDKGYAKATERILPVVEKILEKSN